MRLGVPVSELQVVTCVLSFINAVTFAKDVAILGREERRSSAKWSLSC